MMPGVRHGRGFIEPQPIPYTASSITIVPGGTSGRPGIQLGFRGFPFMEGLTGAKLRRRWR